MGEIHDEVVSISFLGGFLDLLLCHIRSAISDVFRDGSSKEDGLLTHHSNHLSQVAYVKSADVVAIYTHLQIWSQTDKHT